MIPTQMNCAHSDEGWCLRCVGKLQSQHEQEITRLKSFGCELDKNYIRLDDPVVTGLYDSLKLHVQVLPDVVASGALSAYEARVKEVGK